MKSVVHVHIPVSAHVPARVLARGLAHASIPHRSFLLAAALGVLCIAGCGGASSRGAASPPPADAIDPVAPHRAWTYDVSVFGPSSVCAPGRHDGKVTREDVVDGKHAYEVASFCPGMPSFFYAFDGDRVELDYKGQWVLALETPVQEGTTWSNGAGSFTWHDAGKVTVPAGTFSQCWKATENASFTAYTVFCRGVGAVRWYRKDDQGNGFDAQLVAKNF
jgi:hypothetical protein